MPLTLSNSTIAADALSGTVIGTFNADGVRFQGNTRPEDFLIVGRLLVSTWDGRAMPGTITINVQAPGGVLASFVITVTPAAVVAPSVTTIQINGSASPITVAAGAAITATVAGGPGTPGDWLGVYAVGSLSGPADPASWKWLSTDAATTAVPATGANTGTVHLVVPAQAGQYVVRFFPNYGWIVSATSAQITVTAPLATPIITVSPTIPNIPDTTPKNAVVASYSVTMSDGSAFTGTIAFGAPNFDNGGMFALTAVTHSTGNIIVNPAGPGVGPNLATITDHVTLVATE